jgi:hypothetical protein
MVKQIFRDMSLTSKLIAKLLVLCGISLTCTACYAPGNVTMYMTDIEGMVFDEDTGQPIEGIKISSNHSGGVISDEEGRFNLKHFDHPPTTIMLTVEDIDGPENGGEYATQTVERELVQENFAPEGAFDGPDTQWRAGLKIDFALTPKIAENNENE